MQGHAQNQLPLLLSPAHPCPYLPQETARTAFLDAPATDHDPSYDELLARGFRRTGAYFYRPSCERCHACVPLRIPVKRFQPDRSQRRAWRHNQDLEVRTLTARFVPDHFALYARYLDWKHPNGGMQDSSPHDYANFLFGPKGVTQLTEMRLHGVLAAVAVLDRLENAFSAIYTFYAPELARRSLGTFAILWEIHEAQRHGLEWLYLGYWVAGSRKMTYKDSFRPYERLTVNGWKRVLGHPA